MATRKINYQDLKTLIKEVLTEETQMSTNISKFVFFGYNYPHDFIQQIWRDEQVIANHLQNKFDMFYKKVGPNAVMNRFYVELDNENREKLERYILSK